MALAYQSLYRRYRSRRFDELRGQDHVVRALRTAVREGRVGHAYLFSGPRGTGKTSTARILAKVLNCAAPVDGEPCGTCENCRAVDEGRLVDWLLELDAASHNGVAAIRELIERIPLGTSGNRKVVILDEVHMLSTGASNALLKSLEEPPAHVVFVLATTDPQKVLPTIRSRTQHLEFHLLPADELADHVRWVIADAELGLGEDAVADVVRRGGGSARDTLSALDQVAAMGGVVDTGEPVDAVLQALAARDAGAALVAVADAVAAGRDPRVLGERIVVRLRDAFLAVMGAPDRHLPDADLQRASELGQALGPAGITRALDVVGEALTELGRKPDPRVVLEVALVRVCRPDADRSLEAVIERVERLERSVAEGRPPSGAAGAGPEPGVSVPLSPGPGGEHAETDAPGGADLSRSGPADAARAELSRRARGPVKAVKKAARPRAAAPRSNPEPTPDEPPAPAGSEGTPDTGSPPVATLERSDPGPPAPGPGRSATGAPAAAPAADGPSRDELTIAWSDQILDRLNRGTRAIYSTGRFVAVEGDTAVFALANAPTRDHCEKKRAEVEAVLSDHAGRPVRLRLITDDEAPAGAPGREPATPSTAGTTTGSAPDDEDVGDVRGLPDAPDVGSGVDRLADAFPGAELIDEGETR